MNNKVKHNLAIGTFIFFTSTPVFSENTTTQIEEIIVIAGEKIPNDSSLISPDAESLLSIAGDVNDPLKAIQSLPGITFGGGDLDEPIIRGGSPEDNLFLIDGIAVNTKLFLNFGIHGAIEHFLDETYFEPRVGILYQATKEFRLYSRIGIHHTSPEKQKLLLLNELANKQESEWSRQYLVGQKWEIGTGWRLQTEAWFKDFVQTEFVATPLERKLEGTAYGFDLLLAKPISERFYGWLALSSSDGSFKDSETRLEVDNPFTPSLSTTIAMNYDFDNGWKIGTKYRFQSGDLYTPLLSTSIESETSQPRPVFGVPFSAQLNDYHRLDIRIGKTSQYSSAEVLYYVDILNITDRKNTANRTFPARNTVVSPSAPLQATILPNNDEGIPLFIALGVNISF